MGRSRKPAEAQKGHLTLMENEQRAAEQQSVVTDREQLKKVPSKFLINNLARLEWKRITLELASIDIVGNLDRNNLIGYCNSWAKYVEVTQQLEEQELTVSGKNGEVKNPLIEIQKNYADEIRKFGSLCGLTIDSRLKAAAIKTEQTKDQMKEMFGI